MICSFDFTLSKEDYKEEELKHLMSKLENVQKTLDGDDAIKRITGNIENYKITINLQNGNVYFQGSLSKFYFESNIFSFEKSEVWRGLKKLKEATGMPIFSAVPRRVDIAVNLFLEHRFKTYTPYLEETEKYTRNMNSYGGVTYTKGNIELVFYNKYAELRSKDKEHFRLVRELMAGTCKGIMRIELRLKSRLRELLLPESPHLKVRHFITRKVQQRLAELLLGHYNAIEKSRSILAPTHVSGLKEMKDILAAKQIQAYGFRNLLRDIDEMARVNGWDAKKKCILKKEIKRLYHSDSIGALSKHVKEIEDGLKTDMYLLEWLKTPEMIHC